MEKYKKELTLPSVLKSKYFLNNLCLPFLEMLCDTVHLPC